MTVNGRPFPNRPTDKAQTYRVRYIFGVVDPRVDRRNELHIVSYDKGGTSARLYELLAAPRRGGGYVLTWINTARLKRRKDTWIVEDTLGGIYSYRRAQKLVARIPREKELSISLQSVKPAGLVCRSH